MPSGDQVSARYAQQMDRVTAMVGRPDQPSGRRVKTENPTTVAGGNQELIWINAFTVEAGREVILSVDVAWGAVTPVLYVAVKLEATKDRRSDPREQRRTQ